MRIAINTRLLLPRRLDGIGWFTAETMRRIVHDHPEHEFFLLFDRNPDIHAVFHGEDMPDNTHVIVLHPQARHPLLWILYFEWSTPRALKKYKIDLYLSTDGWMSLRTSVPTLTVIHDLNFEHASDYLKPIYQKYMTFFFPRFAHKAARVATVSEFSKKDLVDTYNISPDKVDVVYDGSHSDYKPHTPDEQSTTRQRYTNGKRYFIFIGSISRRKNLTNILLAFDKMKEECSTDSIGDTKLVVVGCRTWWQDELKQAYDTMKHQQDVIFQGHVDAEELSRLMSASIALVYPSLFEGFGIPIIEAFNARTAVITANVTSMPEVAGDAAIIVDPYSVEAICDAMTSLATDDTLRDTLIERGWQRRDIFNWDRTASLLWESLMRTASKQ